MLASDTKCADNKGTNDTQLASIAGALYTAGMFGVNGVLLAEMYNNADTEYEIAERYYDIANNWLSHYKNVFVPVEDKEVEATKALKDPEPIYETARGRGRVIAWLQFKDATPKAMRCTSKYCTGFRKDMLSSMVAAQSNAVAMADGLGYRNERAYIQAMKDRNFSRRMGTIKHGRNMVGDAKSFGTMAANIYGDLFSQTWQGLMGANQFLGYFSNRHETQYPRTYLAGNPGYQDVPMELQDNFYMSPNDPRVAVNQSIGYGG